MRIYISESVPDFNQRWISPTQACLNKDTNARALSKLQWGMRLTNKTKCLSAGNVFSCLTFTAIITFICSH